jgi:hypothetical protein
MSWPVAVKRGCGTRIENSVYWECGMGPDGQPIEHFLICPPRRVPEGLTLSSLGVQLLEVGGVTHVVDVVGQEYYPNVADFIEEVRRFGLSRKLPHTLDFSRLTWESRLLVAHARAVVTNMGDWFESPDIGELRCPKLLEGHPRGVECCGWVWWNDIEGGVKSAAAGDSDPLLVVREMPSFRYNGHGRPEGVTPQYELGFFASLPLGRIAVVQGDKSAERIERIKGQTDVIVEEVSE